MTTPLDERIAETPYLAVCCSALIIAAFVPWQSVAAVVGLSRTLGKG